MSADRSDGHPAARSRPPPNRRRDKPQLSCNTCRRRKARCDRRQPCSYCSARDLTCHYTSSSSIMTAGKVHPEERLAQLERLILSMMPRRAVADDTQELRQEHDTIDTPSENGRMITEHQYVGGEHWDAILDSVADLKQSFRADEQHDTQDGLRSQPSIRSRSKSATEQTPLFYGSFEPRSKDDIIAALPSRLAVDRYLSRYFNFVDVAPYCIHSPSFLRQYEEFWTNPKSASIVWIGLLYSKISLGSLATEALDDESNDQARQVASWRNTIVECLRLGNYTKAGPYVLETIIHYVHIEFYIRPDSEKDVWFVHTLSVNIAMRMGIHRDADHFAEISPLQSEMRRRMWTVMLQGDILMSTSLGMPRLIADWKCDTKEPRNLNDSDLDEDISELPASRPESELTTVLPLIGKRRMQIALGAVSDLCGSVKSRSYVEVLKTDGMLHDTRASIPGPLHPKPMAASIADSPQLIMSRLFISHMFHRAQLMLHRRFLFVECASEIENRLAYSRKSCLDASLGALALQVIFEEETAPSGQLHTMRWRVTSMHKNLFLTATMVLCSMLLRGKMRHQEEEIVMALRRALIIWSKGSDTSEEARKAATTIRFVLEKIGLGDEGIAASDRTMGTFSPAGMDEEFDIDEFWKSDEYGFSFDPDVNLDDVDWDLLDESRE